MIWRNLHILEEFIRFGGMCVIRRDLHDLEGFTCTLFGRIYVVWKDLHNLEELTGFAGIYLIWRDLGDMEWFTGFGV